MVWLESWRVGCSDEYALDGLLALASSRGFSVWAATAAKTQRRLATTNILHLNADLCLNAHSMTGTDSLLQALIYTLTGYQKDIFYKFPFECYQKTFIFDRLPKECTQTAHSDSVKTVGLEVLVTESARTRILATIFFFASSVIAPIPALVPL